MPGRDALTHYCDTEHKGPCGVRVTVVPDGQRHVVPSRQDDRGESRHVRDLVHGRLRN